MPPAKRSTPPVAPGPETEGVATPKEAPASVVPPVTPSAPVPSSPAPVASPVPAPAPSSPILGSKEEKKRRSRIILVCPVSNRQAPPLDYSPEGEGTWVVVDPGEPLDLQEGWGRLVLEIAVPNPEIQRVLAERAEQIEESMKLVRAALADPSTPQADSKRIRAMIQSGEARAEVVARTEAALPLPSTSMVLQRISFPVLAPEALGWAVAALIEAGFPIETPE